MELKSDLWHTQTPSTSSLRDQPTLFLRDRSTSVSQLVSRYQMTTENHSQENAEIKAEAIAKQMSSLVTTKPHVEALDRGNDNKDQSHSKTGLTRSKSMGSLQIKVVSFQSLKARFESKEDTQKKVTSKQSTSRSVEATQEKTAEAKQINDPPLETEKHPPKSLKMKGDKWESPQIKTSLVRSKSTGSLRSSSGSIEALRARFESKVDAQNMARGVKNSPASIKPAEILQVTDREAEGKSLKEKPRSQTADAPQKEGKDAPSSQKVVTRPRGEMRKTIAGIDFEKMVAIKADENRQSFTGFRDSSFEPTKDKLSVSVKAISALLLSKGAPKEPANGLLQTAQDQSPRSGRTFTNIKFQPACQEMCSACLKPVYPMERITTHKCIFHKACFSCKQCKKKLSVSNYAPLHEEFYCTFHYQQLFRRKGNYDEGFGYAQHKNRWLLKKTEDNIQL